MVRIVFTVVYFAGLVVGSFIRSYYRRMARREPVAVEQSTPLDIALTSLQLVGMFILPLIYAATPWLNFANYALPTWAGVIGAALYAVSMWLLWRSHADLGRQWTMSLELRDEHRLITGGVYRHMRHPMYAAHLLWFIAQPLLLHNWIAGFGSLVLFIPLYLERVPREERMLLEQFGDEYRDYMRRTGRVFPRFRR